MTKSWLFLVFALLVVSPSCTHAPPTVTTQAGQTAFTADQIVLRVNELERAAIAGEANGSIPTATARAIVTFCVDADKTLAVTPQGWQKTVQTAWLALRTQIGFVSNQTIATLMNAVDLSLASLGA